jgi:hypothetical protein
MPLRTQAVRPPTPSRTLRRPPLPALVVTPAATAQAAETLPGDAACVPLKAPPRRAAPASTSQGPA